MLSDDEQRLFDTRNRAAAPTCEDVIIVPKGDVSPRPRAFDCDEPAVQPEELFFPPNAPTPDEGDEHVLPAPIPVKGSAFSISCATDQIAVPVDAPPVSYATGELLAATQLVYLDSIPSMSTGELYRVAGLVGRLVTLVNLNLAALVAANGSWDDFDASIQDLLGVLPAVAADIREALVAAQLRANSVVVAVAAAELRCVWPSKLLRAYCDLGSPLGYLLAISPELPRIGVESVEAPAGVATSNVSQQDANAKAGRIAASGLTCLFRNVVKTVTCAEVEGGAFFSSPGDPLPSLLWPPDADSLRSPQLVTLASLVGEYYVADTLPDTRTLRLVSTTAAGSVTGRSQEEADSIALLLATAGLGCFFPSRPRIFSCVDVGDYGNAAAHAELLGGRAEDDILNEMATGDILGVREDNVGVVGNVTVDTTVGVRTQLPAGMFVGATSEEAEDLAEAFAAATLECLWGNVELTYACDDAPATVAAHRPSVYPGALVAANKRGKSVFSSSLGQTLVMLASPRKSAPYEVSVIARQVLSEDGQAAANDEAAAFAVSQLGCVYCNPRIAPVCALFVTSRPAGVDQLPPYTADNVEVLPVVAALLAPGQSADATAGVPGVRYSAATSWGPPADYLTALTEGATFTCGDFDEVVAVVDVVGAIPIRDLVTATPDASCLYGNDRTAAACRTNTTRPDGVEVVNFHTPEEIEEYEDYLSARSTAGSIVVVENTFQEAGTSGKATANLMAKAHALSQLNCYFESPKLKLYCGASTAPLAGAGGAFPPVGVDFPSAAAFTNPAAAATVYGDGKFGVVVGGEYVHVRSKGYKQSAVGTISPDEKPVRLSYGVGRSDASPTDALLQALLIGLGQLNCFFLNAAQPAACSSPSVTTFAAGAKPTALVSADLYPSDESQAAADDFAKLVAEASLVCLYTHPNPVVVSVCSPTTRILVSPGIVPARFTVSPLSSADALANSTALAASFVVCDSPDDADSSVSRDALTSPFGISMTGAADEECCKIGMRNVVSAAADTKLFSPEEDLTYTSVNIDKSDVGDFCSGNLYVYLEANLHDARNGLAAQRFWATSGALTVTSAPLALFTGSPGSGFNAVRRLVAEIHGNAADCSDLSIIQSVTAAQKISAYVENGKLFPVITDKDSPAPPEVENLQPFKVTTAVGGGSIIDVEAGTVYDHSGAHNVSKLEGSDASDGNFVVLKIERSNESRDITSVAMSVEETVEDSTSDTQYIPIAKIKVLNKLIANIEQLQFGDVSIFEALAISNGKFKLVTVNTASRKAYDPTAPA